MSRFGGRWIGLHPPQLKPGSADLCFIAVQALPDGAGQRMTGEPKVVFDHEATGAK